MKIFRMVGMFAVCLAVPVFAASTSASAAVCLEYDDFNDNTLEPWTASGGPTGYSITFTDGVLHMTAPTSSVYSPAASVNIEKDISLSGDFVVTIDTVQQSVDNKEWRHQITLWQDDTSNFVFMDGDATRAWQPGWIVAKTVNGVRTELFYGNTNGQGGIENVWTTMKIKKVGSVYTFSIIRNGVETIVTTQNIPEFSSFSKVSFPSWAHYIPVDMLIDNFMAWNDPTATSCENYYAFTAMSAQADVNMGPLANDDTFTASADFTTSTTGIDPMTEDVNISVLNYSVTFPAGSFTYKNGKYDYQGTMDGVGLTVSITTSPASVYSLSVEGTGAEFTGSVLPPTMEIVIGDDGDSVTLDTGALSAVSP